jgi:hypothetical protein
VDAVGYLDAIEKVPSDQVVVVCIYDPEVSITLEREAKYCCGTHVLQLNTY